MYFFTFSFGVFPGSLHHGDVRIVIWVFMLIHCINIYEFRSFYKKARNALFYQKDKTEKHLKPIKINLEKSPVVLLEQVVKRQFSNCRFRSKEIGVISG